jgi:MOSC domain-containing protein YiiM
MAIDACIDCVSFRPNENRDGMTGEVIGIYIASKAEDLPHLVQRARGLPDRGLDGDRYAKGIGTFSNHKGQRDVSLIESEAIEAFARESGTSLSAGESRRNILTRGVRLNDLVGKEFQVGQVRLRGLRLCEPCTHLVRLTKSPATLRGLVHRGGLYAAILNEGEITVGDSIDGFGESP